MRSVFGLAVSISVMAAATQTAWGQDGHCGWGEVQATFQALPVGYVQVTQFGTQESLAGLGGGTNNCQFRLYTDGATYTFNEGDLVVGGTIWQFDYPNAGFTRAEAIEELEAIDDRVWFGPTGETPVEQVLERTAYKHYHRPDWGLTLYQQRAFVAQLAPGEYDSYWESTYYGVPELSALVHIIVLPKSSP